MTCSGRVGLFRTARHIVLSLLRSEWGLRKDDGGTGEDSCPMLGQWGSEGVKEVRTEQAAAEGCSVEGRSTLVWSRSVFFFLWDRPYNLYLLLVSFALFCQLSSSLLSSLPLCLLQHTFMDKMQLKCISSAVILVFLSFPCASSSP